MSWKWSHTKEAINKAKENMKKLPKKELIEIFIGRIKMKILRGFLIIMAIFLWIMAYITELKSEILIAEIITTVIILGLAVDWLIGEISNMEGVRKYYE